MTAPSAQAETPATFAPPWPSRSGVTITGVRAIVTAPYRVPLVVVRIDTSEPGLYGLGCATFTQRWKAVVSYLEEHVARLLIGRYPGDIEDLTRLVKFSSYWREGPVGNNALSGVDQALWDIAGKRAGLPVHELLGGKVRAAVDTYAHTSGADIDATLDKAEARIADGWRHIRLQTAQHGIGGYGALLLGRPGAEDLPYPDGWQVSEYLLQTPRLFEAARDRLGAEVELLHDAHSRLTPKQAVTLARDLEEFRPFFLEDVLAPEHWDRLPQVRAASPVPLAVGELTTSVTDAARLILGGGVDYIRCHLSAVGGLTVGRKLAAAAELSGVRTAWHAPGDTSPIGVAASVALDITSPAFGIQECHVFDDATHEVFPGTLRVDRGWLRPNEEPGWGIEIDERAAATHQPGLSWFDGWAAGVRGIDGGLLAP